MDRASLFTDSVYSYLPIPVYCYLPITIALNYNAGAQKVAEAGYVLAGTLGGHTILLHVTFHTTYYSSLNYSPIMGFDSFSNLDEIQTNTEKELKRTAGDFLDNIKWNLGDEIIQIMKYEGGYAKNILQPAKKMKADMRVVETHSRKGLDKVFLRRVVENILHHSTLPLFIIPVKSDDEK